MRCCADLLTGGTGWDGWVLMCGAVAIFWVLAVAGMVTLFGASAQDSHSRTRLRPEISARTGTSGEESEERTGQSGSRG
jgi:hypothetical protein